MGKKIYIYIWDILETFEWTRSPRYFLGFLRLGDDVSAKIEEPEDSKLFLRGILWSTRNICHVKPT